MGLDLASRRAPLPGSRHGERGLFPRLALAGIVLGWLGAALAYAQLEPGGAAHLALGEWVRWAGPLVALVGFGGGALVALRGGRWGSVLDAALLSLMLQIVTKRFLTEAGVLSELVWLGVWGLTAMLGLLLAGRGWGATVRRRWLRRVAAPGAALLLGAAWLDAPLAPPSALLGGGVALLALLLAVRVWGVQRALGRHAEEQRRFQAGRTLVEAGRALVGATELGRSLELAAEWACRLLDAPAAAVELLDAERAELEVRALHGLPSHLLGSRTPVAGSFSGEVVEGGHPLTISEGAAAYPDAIGAGMFPTAAAPLCHRGRSLGVISVLRYDRPFLPEELELLGTLADQAAPVIHNAQLFEQVRTLSRTDPLTGLANRRQLEHDLAREFAAARRGRRLIAVLFDLDYFKEYNDRFGHVAGDEVLRTFGAVLAVETRAMNLAARYGGDEFVVLLSDTPRDGVDIFVQRVAARFDEELARLGRGLVTMSAGVAEFHPEMREIDELISAADRALYSVKAVRPAAAGS